MNFFMMIQMACALSHDEKKKINTRLRPKPLQSKQYPFIDMCVSIIKQHSLKTINVVHSRKTTYKGTLAYSIYSYVLFCFFISIMAIRENPIFKTKESIFTIGLVTFEAVVICILEGIVIMNHLGLVSNCNPDTVGIGLTA